MVDDKLMDNPDELPPPGLLVAGLGGGSGKSVVAVGLAAALSGRGRRVAVFKKGPDYIDAGWLARAAARPCYNLDPHLMSTEVIRASFAEHSREMDLAVVEGNRGLFDGVDLEGSCSSAELARILALPVLLVVDCTKTTRTVAAQVLGCLHFEPGLNLVGVVLNRIGGQRHQRVAWQAVEHYTGLPVLGAVPRSRHDIFPQRHLGVTPAAEHGEVDKAVSALAAQAEKYLDLPRIEQAASVASTSEQSKDLSLSPSLTVQGDRLNPHSPVPPEVAGREKTLDGEQNRDVIPRVRIGYLRDAAFQFYYPDNLEALEAAGAELIALNALEDRELPSLDALYIGGGFPETSAPALAANAPFREAVRNAAADGLPIYAECGGLIYLGQALFLEGREYPLAGVFPVRFGLSRKPQAHGYTELKVERENPFYSPGTVIRGHEFRYSTVEWVGESPAPLVCSVSRGVGFAWGRDGLSTGRVLAIYTHVHALSTPEWAPAMVAAAARRHSGSS